MANDKEYGDLGISWSKTNLKNISDNTTNLIDSNYKDYEQLNINKLIVEDAKSENNNTGIDGALYSMSNSDISINITKENTAFNYASKFNELLINKEWQKKLNTKKFITQSSNEIGKLIYERIQNFITNYIDVDTCHYNSLISKYASLNIDIVNSITKNIPNKLDYLINLFSLSKQYYKSNIYTLNVNDTNLIKNIENIKSVTDLQNTNNIINRKYFDNFYSHVVYPIIRNELYNNYDVPEFKSYITNTTNGVYDKFELGDESYYTFTILLKQTVSDKVIATLCNKMMQRFLAENPDVSVVTSVSEQTGSYIMYNYFEKIINSNLSYLPDSTGHFPKLELSDYISFNSGDIGIEFKQPNYIDIFNIIERYGITRAELLKILKIRLTAQKLTNICNSICVLREDIKALRLKDSKIGTAILIEELIADYFYKYLTQKVGLLNQKKVANTLVNTVNDYIETLSDSTEEERLVKDNLLETFKAEQKTIGIQFESMLRTLKDVAANLKIDIIEYIDTTPTYLNIIPESDYQLKTIEYQEQVEEFPGYLNVNGDVTYINFDDKFQVECDKIWVIENKDTNEITTSKTKPKLYDTVTYNINEKSQSWNDGSRAIGFTVKLSSDFAGLDISIDDSKESVTQFNNIKNLLIESVAIDINKIDFTYFNNTGYNIIELKLAVYEMDIEAPNKIGKFKCLSNTVALGANAKGIVEFKFNNDFIGETNKLFRFVFVTEDADRSELLEPDINNSNAEYFKNITDNNEGQGIVSNKGTSYIFLNVNDNYKSGGVPTLPNNTGLTITNINESSKSNTIETNNTILPIFKIKANALVQVLQDNIEYRQCYNSRQYKLGNQAAGYNYFLDYVMIEKIETHGYTQFTRFGKFIYEPIDSKKFFEAVNLNEPETTFNEQFKWFELNETDEDGTIIKNQIIDRFDRLIEHTKDRYIYTSAGNEILHWHNDKFQYDTGLVKGETVKFGPRYRLIEEYVDNYYDMIDDVQLQLSYDKDEYTTEKPTDPDAQNIEYYGLFMDLITKTISSYESYIARIDDSVVWVPLIKRLDGTMVEIFQDGIIGAIVKRLEDGKIVDKAEGVTNYFTDKTIEKFVDANGVEYTLSADNTLVDAAGNNYTDYNIDTELFYAIENKRYVIKTKTKKVSETVLGNEPFWHNIVSDTLYADKTLDEEAAIIKFYKNIGLINDELDDNYKVGNDDDISSLSSKWISARTKILSLLKKVWSVNAQHIWYSPIDDNNRLANGEISQDVINNLKNMDLAYHSNIGPSMEKSNKIKLDNSLTNLENWSNNTVAIHPCLWNLVEYSFESSLKLLTISLYGEDILNKIYSEPYEWPRKFDYATEDNEMWKDEDGTLSFKSVTNNENILKVAHIVDYWKYYAKSFFPYSTKYETALNRTSITEETSRYLDFDGPFNYEALKVVIDKYWTAPDPKMTIDIYNSIRAVNFANFYIDFVS